MTHGSLKPTLICNLDTSYSPIAKQQAWFSHVETITLNHGERAACVNGCDQEAWHTLFFTNKSFHQCSYKLCCMTGHNYLFQVKLSRQGPLTDLFKIVSVRYYICHQGSDKDRQNKGFNFALLTFQKESE